MSLFEFIGALATAVAVFGYINHRFIHLPDTVGITAMGLLASLGLAVVGRYVPGAVDWATEFSRRLDFPDVVFHGLLSILLFAGSLHINISDLARQRLPVVVLATVGVLLSTALVGLASFWVLSAFGSHIPISYCFLFGALISPTDPIAVLGVLKTAGVPKALEMVFSGESLFNDGTGVVLFLVLVGIVTGTSEPTFATIGGLLAKEVLGALVVGLLVGYGAFFMLKGVDSYAVEILITLAVATGGYSFAERLHVSAPLAVVVMGLVIGNHGARSAMSHKTRQHLFPFWELLDEILNLMLFGLIGIKLLALASDDISWYEAVALVPVVLLARFISVGLPKLALRPWLTPRPNVVKVMTWGGLRGGISIALALSLPDFDGRLLFVQATFAVVLFSLLVQAPTLGWALKKFGVSTDKDAEADDGAKAPRSPR
ncbi:MAG: sodium:proton antiporter [Caldimonas sp.]